MAKIEELDVSPCLGAFHFSGVRCHVYLEPLASLFFLFEEENMLLKPSSEDFSELRRLGGQWKVIKLFQDLGDDLFTVFVTSKAVQFAGLLSQKKTV